MDRTSPRCSDANRATACPWAAEVGLDMICPDPSCLNLVRAGYRACAARLGEQLEPLANCVGDCALTGDECRDGVLRQFSVCTVACGKENLTCLRACSDAFARESDACRAADSQCRSSCLAAD
jgi:hypothetical protein